MVKKTPKDWQEILWDDGQSQFGRIENQEFTNMTLKRRNEQGYARILVFIQRMYDNRPSPLLAPLLIVFSGMIDW